MNSLIYFIWIILGIILAFVVLMTQRWSTMLISPEAPRLSKWLIIGGAVIRWIVIFIIFSIVLSISISGLLVVFFTFMIARIILLIYMEDMPNRFIHKRTSVKDC